MTGLIKIAGISLLLVGIWAAMSWFTPESFLKPNNIENLLRRTALYGVLGIGVAFVIITGGIDLSIGSVVCLSGCLLAILLEVEFRAIDEIPVISASRSGDVLVKSDHPFQMGDGVRFDRGRRANPLLGTITAIEYEEAGTSRLTLDQPFSRDDDAGFLVRAHPLERVADKGRAIVTKSELHLAAGDQLWLVHPEKGIVKRRVTDAEPGDQATTTRIDEPVDADAQWRVIALRRTSIASVPVALLVTLVAGLGIGLVHGLLITKLQMQPFVVTLCSLLIFRSLSRWLANDQMVGFGNEYASLHEFGSGKWTLLAGDGWTFGIPWPFFVLAAVAIAALILLNLTVWGRYMMALGRNEEATRYSGVNTDRNKILAYMICAMLAALGGTMFALNSNSIAPYSFGNFFELYAIAAAVLGGCSLRGGEGGITGVIVGTALMQTLSNLIVLWKIPQQLELAVVGVVILLGVMADETLKRFTRRL